MGEDGGLAEYLLTFPWNKDNNKMPPQTRLGDKSKCDADAHGCPACPHVVQGPAVTGAATVLVNNKPAVRATDSGVHVACCGPNIWVAAMGSFSVMIEYLPAHRKDDMDIHCGGIGKMIEGSPDVNVGG